MNRHILALVFLALGFAHPVESQVIVWRTLGTAAPSDTEVLGTMVGFVDGIMSGLVRYEQNQTSVDLIQYGWGRPWGNFKSSNGSSVLVAPNPAIPVSLDHSSTRLPGIPLGENRFGTAFLSVWRPEEISVGTSSSNQNSPSIGSRCVLISVVNYAEPKGLGLEYQLLNSTGTPLPLRRAVTDAPFASAIRLTPTCIPPSEAQILSGVSDEQDPTQTDSTKVMIRLRSFAPEQAGYPWHHVDELHSGWREVYPLKRSRLWNMFFREENPLKLRLVTHVLIVLLPQRYDVTRIPFRSRNDALPGKPWLLPNIEESLSGKKRFGLLPTPDRDPSVEGRLSQCEIDYDTDVYAGDQLVDESRETQDDASQGLPHIEDGQLTEPSEVEFEVSVAQEGDQMYREKDRAYE